MCKVHSELISSTKAYSRNSVAVSVSVVIGEEVGALVGSDVGASDGNDCNDLSAQNFGGSLLL